MKKAGIIERILFRNMKSAEVLPFIKQANTLSMQKRAIQRS